MRWALLGLTALVVLAIGMVVLQGGVGGPEPHLVAPAGTSAPADGSAFVIRPAPAPTAGQPAVDPTKPDLDSVMQRLRAGTGQPAADATPTGTTPTGTAQVVINPPATVPTTPAAPAPGLSQPTPAVVVPDSAPRWTSVSGQGTRWRLTRGPGPMTLSIDLGNGQVADVHVQPAFANLDSAAMNTRVDYLKQTILQSFSPRSASYSFGRDGSISLEP